VAARRQVHDGFKVFFEIGGLHAFHPRDLSIDVQRHSISVGLEKKSKISRCVYRVVTESDRLERNSSRVAKLLASPGKILARLFGLSTEPPLG
jgi:hypothetical protein